MPEYHFLGGGPAVDIVPPIFQRRYIPAIYRWVKVGGEFEPSKATHYLDAFIKSAWYQIDKYQCTPPAATRKAAFLLGVTRCVMMAEHGIKEADLDPNETAGPYINVGQGEGGTVTHSILVGPSECRSRLTDRLELSPEETAVLRTVVQGARGIIPLQGYSLITEGYRYCTETHTRSFKAFKLMETQLWVGDAASTYFKDDIDFVRDIMWNMAAQPVSQALKLKVATDPATRRSLQDAKLSSAACRIPAVELDLRVIDTYSKLCKPIFEKHGGSLDNRVFHDIKQALGQFPMGGPKNEVFTFGPYRANGGSVAAGNRDEVVAYAMEVLERAMEPMAMCFGYYSMLIENKTIEGRSAINLTRAVSLKNLWHQRSKQYSAGYEMAKKTTDQTFISAPIHTFY